MKSVLKKLGGLIVKASEIAEETGQFLVFRTYLQLFFQGSSEAILKAGFHESEPMKFNFFFFINLNFYFRILAQKCLKPCANDVLKFKFFFLNLSSKVSAGVRVRMSKYPYLDKGVSCMQDFL